MNEGKIQLSPNNVQLTTNILLDTVVQKKSVITSLNASRHQLPNRAKILHVQLKLMWTNFHNKRSSDMSCIQNFIIP